MLADMAISFTTRVEDGVLYVTASGFDESLEDTQKYSYAVIQASKQTRVKKVLCDERQLDYQLSTIDLYVLAEFIVEHAPVMAKVALVSNECYKSDIQFWEIVSQNRGLVVKVFFDLEEAIAWIKV